ncbi:TIGR02996 domain-containing protein [Urbifossiella limnaea]|uniref:Uncharacterized protein n=1 Tax=Urbifossiella limnaea TaxID=2528023 RepID=A0A517XPS5_9BACT|nr:TIGR02996 domain-containing protein [Urbifossiella limnaea]QDU19492.1 hypothetical protein ETAA1_14190 [Urbifossiella limnaea]
MDEAAFLYAILDSLDDDTPRLMFADWLDDFAERVRCRVCFKRKYSRNCRMYGWERYVPNSPARRAEFIRVAALRGEGKTSKQISTVTAISFLTVRHYLDGAPQPN